MFFTVVVTSMDTDTTIALIRIHLNEIRVLLCDIAVSRRIVDGFAFVHDEPTHTFGFTKTRILTPCFPVVLFGTSIVDDQYSFTTMHARIETVSITMAEIGTGNSLNLVDFLTTRAYTERIFSLGFVDNLLSKTTFFHRIEFWNGCGQNRCSSVSNGRVRYSDEYPKF